MKIYYSPNEIAGRHKILAVWCQWLKGEEPDITYPYLTLDFDEEYNRRLAGLLLANNRGMVNLPDRFYVDSSSQLRDEFGSLVVVNPNPQKESYKLSQLYGITQAQLETYIDNNVTTWVQAREYLKKLSAVVLWLVKQSDLG